MNAKQIAKLKMYRATEQYCDNNPLIVASNVAFQTAFNNFKVKITAIINLTQQGDVVLKGITQDKQALKQNLCQMTADIAKLIFAYASATSNNTLKQEVNFSPSALAQTRDGQLVPRCQNIHDRGISNLSALADYGVTVQLLDNLQTAIDNYLAESPKPRTAISQRSTLTANLATLFTETDLILREQMDNLVVAFKTEYPDFVKTYESTRFIVDSPTKSGQPETEVTPPKDKPE